MIVNYWHGTSWMKKMLPINSLYRQFLPSLVIRHWKWWRIVWLVSQISGLVCFPQFGDSQKLRLVRILRSTVMVRVGGGWMALDEFLVKNDPCRGDTSFHYFINYCFLGRKIKNLFDVVLFIRVWIFNYRLLIKIVFIIKIISLEL